MYYAGVGARATPPAILKMMEEFAYERAKQGWILRSGGAIGADSAFARGARAAGGKMEIFSAHTMLTLEMMELAQKHHPAWDRLSPFVKKLMGRNVKILLGPNGPAVQEVACWTPKGEVVGGTGHTIRVAMSLLIPVSNWGK